MPDVHRSRAAIAVACVTLVLTACTASGAATTSPDSSTSSTTIEPPSTSRAPAPSTTTSTAPAPIVPVRVSGPDDGEVTTAVSRALTAIRDARVDGPIAPRLLEHVGEVPGLADAYVAVASTAELADGDRVGVVTLDTDDVLLLADQGDGWMVVGAWLSSQGIDPWAGPAPRRVLVLGSDARPGSDPLVFRMDSIHILTADPALRAGAILGYPRDAWVDSPYGPMRLNALATAGRGVEATYDFFRSTWGLPLEGYVVTGFAGFADLVDAVFGRLAITIPIPIPTQPWYPGFRAGDHELTGERTLEFSRTRKGVPGGDFARSFHHGIVMLAALQMLQDSSVHVLPAAIAELTQHAATNLSAADLIQLGAIALDLDIGAVTNEVLPGTLGRAGGGASVVFLDEGFESIVDDVIDDGVRSTVTD